MNNTVSTPKPLVKRKHYFDITVIQILKKPNWFGMLGLRISKFGGWLFDVTGNTFTKEDYREIKKKRRSK